MPITFPPLKTIDVLSNNLPTQLTSFIGRAREIDHVKKLLTANRLVTLVGAGGCGKTRLSLRVGQELLADFADGVWLIELAAITDAALVPQKAASVFGLREDRARSFTDVLADFLRAKKVLLILDNCEHVIGACAVLAQALLTNCPDVKILTSSRESLNIPGETNFPLPPLPAPDPQNRAVARDLNALAQYESVRLFLERAQSVQPTFALTPENAGAVAQIVARLDGIPLAIELAAARVSALRVEQIAERLDQVFQLLVGGSRTALPRQQTLRALIDWSYDLLSEPECAVFRRLAVFAGGCTLDAAEQVTNDSAPRPDSPVLTGADIFELLTRLVNKSLVIPEEEHAATRYRMLEVIRQYAWEKLRAAGEADQLGARHLDYFARLAQNAEPRLRSAEQFEWLHCLENEQGNLRVACEWAQSHAVSEAGLRLGGALWYFCWVRGHWGEWQKRLVALLARADEAAGAEANAGAHFAAGLLSYALGYPDTARPLMEKSIARAREIAAERPHWLAVALVYRAYFEMYHDPRSAREWCEESLTLSRATGDHWTTAVALSVKGMLTMQIPDYDTARALLNESLGLFGQVGDKRLLGFVHANLGDILYEENALAPAQAHRERALAVYAEIGDKQNRALMLSGLGDIALQQPDYSAARARFAEALELWEALANLESVASSLDNLGRVAREGGAFDAARNFHARALKIRVEQKNTGGMILSLHAFACLATARGDSENAARLWGALEKIRADTDSPMSASDQIEYTKFYNTTVGHLDVATFRRLEAEGQAMSLEQAIQSVLQLNPFHEGGG